MFWVTKFHITIINTIFIRLQIKQKAKQIGAKIITTEKDYVKIPRIEKNNIKVLDTGILHGTVTVFLNQKNLGRNRLPSAMSPYLKGLHWAKN